MTQLRSGAVDKMASIFTKRIWQPRHKTRLIDTFGICQSNEVKREIKKKTVGAKQKFGAYGPPSPPPSIVTGYNVVTSHQPEFPQRFQKKPTRLSLVS